MPLPLVDVVARLAGKPVSLIGEKFVCFETKKAIKKSIVDDAKAELKKLEYDAAIEEINEQVRLKIAECYSIHEEIKLLRTAPSEEFDVYNEHAEACRDWGRQEKELLTAKFNGEK